MTAGRCAGCGMTNPSCKKVEKHIMGCEPYVLLFREGKAPLLPEQEYQRFLREEGSEEAKDEFRANRRESFFERLDDERSQQNVRWATPPDPLE